MKKKSTKKLFQNTIEELVVMYNQGKLKNVIKKAKQLITQYPQSIFLWNILGLTNAGIKKLNEAEKCFQTTIKLKPDFVEAHYNLGNAQKKLGKHSDALASYAQAIKLKPDFVEAHNNLGNTQKELGKHSDALASYVRAIEKKPDYAQSYINYVNLVKIKYDDPILLQLEKIICKKNISAEDKVYSSFAMGKAQLDLNEFDKGFKFLNTGNSLRKKKMKYTIQKSKNIFSKIMHRFKELQFKEEKLNTFSNAQPIFILGMPRSGTTLVEQILSSHSAICGAGELEFLKNAINSIDWQNTKIQKKDIKKIREEYIFQLNKISKLPYITDKMPLNFQWIGFIVYAFPEAKIIHLKRDAMAVCWSNYKLNFESEGMAFSFDQIDIAKYYKLYEDLMEYWHEKFPKKIYDFNYEALTKNQEEQTRKLFEYLEIDWEKAVLNFHKNDRAVQTASNTQIRQKIYQGSSQEWKNYKPWLQPMINHLNKN
jgi:tetratricopeptide (TPR) repeat protein